MLNKLGFIYFILLLFLFLFYFSLFLLYTTKIYPILLQIMLQTQVLRVGQVNESCIRLTQENLIENSIQDCLPYILKPYGLC